MKIAPDKKVRRSLEKIWKRKLQRTLAVIRQPVIDASDTDPHRLKLILPSLLKSDLIHNDIINIWGEVGAKYGTDTENAINSAKSGIECYDVKQDRKQYWNERSKELARRQAGEKAASIIDVEEQAINKVIDEVTDRIVNEGLSIPQGRKALLDGLISDTMTMMEAYQAERIARTEVGQAATNSSWMAAKETGAELKKEWLHSGVMNKDARVEHIGFQEMGPQDMEFEYAPGLKYPLDTAADPGQTINCRCDIIYRT
jgi:hypothetical protein